MKTLAAIAILLMTVAPAQAQKANVTGSTQHSALTQSQPSLTTSHGDQSYRDVIEEDTMVRCVWRGLALGLWIVLGIADVSYGQEASSPGPRLATLAQQAGGRVDSDAPDPARSRVRSAETGFVRGAVAGAVFGAVAVGVLSKANGGDFVTSETWKAAAVVGGIWGVGGAALGACFPSGRSVLKVTPDFGNNRKRVLVRVGW